MDNTSSTVYYKSVLQLEASFFLLAYASRFPFKLQKVISEYWKDIAQLPFSENFSPKYQMFSEICDVKNSKFLRMYGLINTFPSQKSAFSVGSLTLSITCKELNTAKFTKFNKLFQLLKSIFI